MDVVSQLFLSRYLCPQRPGVSGGGREDIGPNPRFMRESHMIESLPLDRCHHTSHLSSPSLSFIQPKKERKVHFSPPSVRRRIRSQSYPMKYSNPPGTTICILLLLSNPNVYLGRFIHVSARRTSTVHVDNCATHPPEMNNPLLFDG